MKILVCGSTRLRNAEKLIELLDELHEQSTITCLAEHGEKAWHIGTIELSDDGKHPPRVRYTRT